MFAQSLLLDSDDMSISSVWRSPQVDIDEQYVDCLCVRKVCIDANTCLATCLTAVPSFTEYNDW